MGRTPGSRGRSSLALSPTWGRTRGRARILLVSGRDHEHLLHYFEYDHLPPRLQAVSRPFCELAHQLVDAAAGEIDPVLANEVVSLDHRETTVALRKLLEAKDAAVRAALPLRPSG